MLKKIITIFALLTLVSMTGCSNNSIPERKRNDPPSELPDTKIEGKELSILEAISQDKDFDGKGILWDGEKVEIIDDELDYEDILDGRAGPFYHELIETKLGATLTISNTPYNSNLFDSEHYSATDSEEEYMVETPERYLSVRKSNSDSYSQLEDEFSKDKELMEVYEESISQRDFRIFTGKIKTPNGKDMIGVILITPDVDRSVFCIKYAGFGNYSDIQSEGYGFMENFFIDNFK